MSTGAYIEIGIQGFTGQARVGKPGTAIGAVEIQCLIDLTFSGRHMDFVQVVFIIQLSLTVLTFIGRVPFLAHEKTIIVLMRCSVIWSGRSQAGNSERCMSRQGFQAGPGDGLTK